RAEALFGAQILLKDVGGVLDFASSGAGQVAAEKRLEHQDERVLLASGELLADHVAGYGPHLRDGYWHAWGTPSLYFSRVRRGARWRGGILMSIGRRQEGLASKSLIKAV